MDNVDYVADLDSFRDLEPAAFLQDGWFIISAKTAEDDRFNTLLAAIINEGFKYEILRGVYEGEDDGRSLLVMAPAHSAGMALARRFSQESILCNRGLVYTDGAKNVPFNGVIYGAAAREQAFFSVNPDNIAFSLNLLWS